MKQLERLLFLQGNRCFFCQKPIPLGEASVEHLLATSNGGPKDDENCVACCKTVNAALGNLSIKAKLQAVINQRGILVCPQNGEAQAAGESDHQPSPSEDERFELVVSNLQTRGPSRPRKLATLRNTVKAVFLSKLSEEEVTSLVARLESHGYVIVQDTKVTYALPQPGT